MRLNFVLDKTNIKIVFKYELNNKRSLNVLYDTGAEYPAWTRGELALKNIFGLDNKNRSNKTVTLKGIGGVLKNCAIWIIPKLKLYDSYTGRNIEIQNFPVAIANGACTSDLIVPNTIFKDCMVQINNDESNRVLTINTFDKNVIEITNKENNAFSVNTYSTGIAGISDYILINSENQESIKFPHQ